ncbi:hypothetical protein EFW17_09070 [Halostreptopolyspora alba]|uniref:Urocanase C-terminal domain-containing protein n=1 Tax=Halostreptopolyspora alba TaxID=2487137 RepID=A0A3N0EBM4_9ACTN|nr:hypothetical protein EFW17_09070 [Nocardiopsaceae bacterium YIM 96095]
MAAERCGSRERVAFRGVPARICWLGRGDRAAVDWPLLDALVSTSSGASWISVHHGGVVGVGFSPHAGQVSVVEGTTLAATEPERALDNDPATGVIRHVDAGYPEAETVARATASGFPRARSDRHGNRAAPTRRAPRKRRGEDRPSTEEMP